MMKLAQKLQTRQPSPLSGMYGDYNSQEEEEEKIWGDPYEAPYPPQGPYAGYNTHMHGHEDYYGDEYYDDDCDDSNYDDSNDQKVDLSNPTIPKKGVHDISPSPSESELTEESEISKTVDDTKKDESNSKKDDSNAIVPAIPE